MGLYSWTDDWTELTESTTAPDLFRSVSHVSFHLQVVKKREDRVFRKFSFRGIDLDQLLGLSKKDLMGMLLARQRRRLSTRGLQPKTQNLINKLRAAKKAAPPGEKPAVIKTHLRNMVILPEMIGSVIGIYNGKVYNVAEIKPDMVGYYLGEFSITYKPIR